MEPTLKIGFTMWMDGHSHGDVDADGDETTLKTALAMQRGTSDTHCLRVISPFVLLSFKSNMMVVFASTTRDIVTDKACVTLTSLVTQMM